MPNHSQPSRHLPPPIYIAGSSLSTSKAGPAFGIPSYSHRNIPPRSKAIRPRLRADTFVDEMNEKNLSPPSSNEDEHLERLANARISRHCLTTDQPPKFLSSTVPRPSSIYSVSSSFHARDPPPSGTFLSVAQQGTLSYASEGHQAQTTCRVWRWRPQKDGSVSELPIYSRRQSAGEPPRTAPGEVPGGRKETENDRIRRLMICPWEVLSPRSMKRLEVTTSDPEKLALSNPHRTRSSTKRVVITVLAAMFILLLVADLLLLNIKLLPPAFQQTSSASGRLAKRDSCMVRPILVFFEMIATF